MDEELFANSLVTTNLEACSLERFGEVGVVELLLRELTRLDDERRHEGRRIEENVMQIPFAPSSGEIRQTQ